jgi:glycosyltransferase involved in cell wall biosynthesis
MPKHVLMIIANSPKPAYFMWFADFANRDKDIQLTQVYLCINKNEIPSNELSQKNVKVIWYYFDFRKNKKIQYIKIFFKLLILFFKLKPDAIQTNLFDDSLPSLLAAKICGIKKRIITKQDTGFHINYFPHLIKFDKLNNMNATHIVAVSDETKNLILKYEKPNPSKIIKVLHGVNQHFFSEFSIETISKYKQKFNLENKKVIGTVSRYVKSKCYPNLINAIEIVYNKRKDIVFLGIGHGPDEEEFNKMIIDKKLENVFILTGKLDYNDMPSIYRCLDIYIHAAEYEPFGFVIAEAIFCKIPVISTKVGAALSLNHLENAYLLNDNSPENIADAILFMLDNKPELTINAFEFAKENFSIECMWKNYKQLFLN